MATRKPKIDPVFRYSPLPVREYDVLYSMFYDPRKTTSDEVYAKWNLCWLSYPHEHNKFNAMNRTEKYNSSDLLDFILCVHAYAGDLLKSSMQLPPLEAIKEILKVSKIPEIRDSHFYQNYKDKWIATMRERAVTKCRPHPLDTQEIQPEVSEQLESIFKLVR